MKTLILSADRMLKYLPPYWHDYAEMQAIMQSEGAEIDSLDEQSEAILTDAFIMTMSESRIKEWETWLGLPPTGTLEDRRLAVLGYFAVISKLTSESIQVLVSTLYKGALSIVRFKDSTIKVTIKPLPEYDNEDLDFSPLLNQLQRRKPCHIALFVDRYISTWGELNRGFRTWNEVKAIRKTWGGVYNFILDDSLPVAPSENAVLGECLLGEMRLGVDDRNTAELGKAKLDVMTLGKS